MLVQSETYKYFGFVLPMLVYLPVVFQKYIYPRLMNKKAEKQNTNKA